jgi:hypothetical protein
VLPNWRKHSGALARFGFPPPAGAAAADEQREVTSPDKESA